MISFCGYAFSQPKDPITKLGQMGSVIKYSSTLITSIVSRPEFGVALCHRKDEPSSHAEHADSKVTLIVKGDFAPAVFSEKSSEKTIAHALLGRYLNDGIDSLSGINGRYVIVVWNGQNNNLYIVNDELGMQRLCWTRVGDTFLFGTHYRPFLSWPGVDSSLNDLAVAEIFTSGYPMQDRTILNGIKLIAPGSILKITRKSVYCSSYRKLTETQILNSADLNQCADRIGETLDEVVGEYANNLTRRLVIPLSGGMDSRTILGFALRAGLKNIQSYTYGHRHTYDVRIGHQLASGNTKHEYIYLPESYVQDHLNKNMLITEGETPAHSYHTSVIENRLNEHVTLWNGFLGDTLSGSRLLNYTTINEKTDWVQEYFKKRYEVWRGIPKSQWESIIMPEYRELFIYGPRHTIIEEVEKSSFSSFEKIAIHVAITQRQRRFVSRQLELLGLNCDVQAPFCDHRMVSAFFSIPSKFLIGQRAYFRMLVRFCPLMSKIPIDRNMRTVEDLDKFDGDISKIPSLSQKLWISTPHALRWRINKFLSKNQRRDSGLRVLALLSNGWLGKHDRQAYAHYEEIIAKNTPGLTDLLSDKSAFLPYFNPEGIKEILGGFPTEAQAFTIFNILTFAYWRKLL